MTKSAVTATVAVVLRDALRFKPAVGSIPYRWRLRDQSGYGAVSANRYLEAGALRDAPAVIANAYLNECNGGAGGLLGLGQLGSPSEIYVTAVQSLLPAARGN
jgi:hypothetical protein